MKGDIRMCAKGLETRPRRTHAEKRHACAEQRHTRLERWEREGAEQRHARLERWERGRREINSNRVFRTLKAKLCQSVSIPAHPCRSGPLYTILCHPCQSGPFYAIPCPAVSIRAIRAKLCQSEQSVAIRAIPGRASISASMPAPACHLTRLCEPNEPSCLQRSSAPTSSHEGCVEFSQRSV